jgi:hypothetical protein
MSTLSPEDMVVIQTSIIKALTTTTQLLEGSYQTDGEKYFTVALPEKGVNVYVQCYVENGNITILRVV